MVLCDIWNIHPCLVFACCLVNHQLELADKLAGGLLLDAFRIDAGRLWCKIEAKIKSLLYPLEKQETEHGKKAKK
jgi:hypothetical protein